MSILPKNFCNMHIARRKMHIAIESILPLPSAQVRESDVLGKRKVSVKFV